MAEGRLLLFGEDAGQTWYHSSSTLQVSSIPNCYFISGAVAFDEPDAVVFVFIEWRDIGIRLRKAEGFAPPSDALRASGRYAQGEVGHDYGSFCLNQDGLVFAVP